jgi:hypothetical protein
MEATGQPAATTEWSLSQIARGALVFGLALATSLSVLLLARRVTAAFDAVLSGLTVVTIGFVLAAVASGFRISWSRCFRGFGRPAMLVAQLVLPTVCVLGVAISLTLPETSAAALACLWTVLVFEEGLWWQRALRGARGRNDPSDRPATVGEPAEINHGDAEPPDLPANVTQQITRSRNDNGADIVSGVIRADFAPGERTTSLHLAFCPPLDDEPEVTVHQLEGPAVAINVRQTETFGTRLELRLTAPPRRHESIVVFFETLPRLG